MIFKSTAHPFCLKLILL